MKNKIETMRCPICPSCGEFMVSTFAFPYAEWACLPCGTTDEFFPHNPTMEVDIKEHDKKKKLWEYDLKVIAFRNGAKCAKCMNKRGCKHCRQAKLDAQNPNYKFKFYKKNKKEEK